VLNGELLKHKSHICVLGKEKDFGRDRIILGNNSTDAG